MLVRKRDTTIDIAKGLGMIFVVLYHAEILAGIWQQFHMPLFAFLSGLLYSDKNNNSIASVGKYAVRKIKGIYIPFVLYNVVFLCLHNILFYLNIYSYVHNGAAYKSKDFIKQFTLILILGGGRKPSRSNVVFNCYAGVYAPVCSDSNCSNESMQKAARIHRYNSMRWNHGTGLL